MEKIETNDPIIPNKSRKRVFFEFVWDLLKVACISLAIIIPVRYFLIQPFYVKGASMEPNLYDHEYLIIDEISYRFNGPERGDIVVFKYPLDQSQYFIKRVIGLPGEKVEVKDGMIYIYSTDQEGTARKYVLNETGYLDPSIKTYGNHAFTLAADEYFMLGDNRTQSLDSRTFGPVYRDLIMGKVWLRGWPFNRAMVFSEVEYGF
ncbi:MAG: signal peptidase I [Patescibacteria group bacterium]